MSSLSVDDQIRRIKRAKLFAQHMHKWLIAGALFLAVVSLVSWHPALLIIAAMLAAIGVFERRAGPNILSALLAYESEEASTGFVAISITAWDTSKTYHATVREVGYPEWKFEFIPQGWKPASRSYKARIWRKSPDNRPTLAIVEEGILVPRYDPIRLSGTMNGSALGHLPNTSH